MDINQRKEQFSRVYVHAVATVAGFTLFEPQVDDDSVDLTLSGRTVAGIPSRPKIDVQLKCTAEDVLREREVVYALSRKNYDELRLTGLVVPRLLVLVHVPESAAEWLRQTEKELALRWCAYWTTLLGQPETTNLSRVTVRLPRANIFDVAGLTGLMARAARKELL